MDEEVFEDAELVWPSMYFRSGRPASELIPPKPASPPPGRRPAAAINAFGSLRLAVAGSRPPRRLEDNAALDPLESFLLSAAMRLAALGSMRRLDIALGSV